MGEEGGFEVDDSWDEATLGLIDDLVAQRESSRARHAWEEHGSERAGTGGQQREAEGGNGYGSHQRGRRLNLTNPSQQGAQERPGPSSQGTRELAELRARVQRQEEQLQSIAEEHERAKEEAEALRARAISEHQGNWQRAPAPGPVVTPALAYAMLRKEEGEGLDLLARDERAWRVHAAVEALGAGREGLAGCAREASIRTEELAEREGDDAERLMAASARVVGLILPLARRLPSGSGAGGWDWREMGEEAAERVAQRLAKAHRGASTGGAKSACLKACESAIRLSRNGGRLCKGPLLDAFFASEGRGAIGRSLMTCLAAASCRCEMDDSLLARVASEAWRRWREDEGVRSEALTLLGSACEGRRGLGWGMAEELLERAVEAGPGREQRLAVHAAAMAAGDTLERDGEGPEEKGRKEACYQLAQWVARSKDTVARRAGRALASDISHRLHSRAP